MFDVFDLPRVLGEYKAFDQAISDNKALSRHDLFRTCDGNYCICV